MQLVKTYNLLGVFVDVCAEEGAKSPGERVLLGAGFKYYWGLSFETSIVMTMAT